MSFRPSTTSTCARASPLRVLQVLLPLSLLLIALVPSISGKTKGVDDELYLELRCICVKTTSAIHPSNIQSLNVIKPGSHCPKVEVIAKLKNGKEICLDPEAPRIRKIVQKMLEGDRSAV